MFDTRKKDMIYNALLVGMSLEDAYIYAGLTEDEIVAVSENDALQMEYRRLTKNFEFSLLEQLGNIARKQEKLGKESATTWMLEHMFPRYAGKPQEEGKIVNISFNNVDPANLDTVEISLPDESSSPDTVEISTTEEN